MNIKLCTHKTTLSNARRRQLTEMDNLQSVNIKLCTFKTNVLNTRRLPSTETRRQRQRDRQRDRRTDTGEDKKRGRKVEQRRRSTEKLEGRHQEGPMYNNIYQDILARVSGRVVVVVVRELFFS